MSKFKIGDRVIVIKDLEQRNTKGKHGVIIHNDGAVVQPWGVEFYEDIETGHDCHGISERDNCLWVDEKDIMLDHKYYVIETVLSES